MCAAAACRSSRRRWARARLTRRVPSAPRLPYRSSQMATAVVAGESDRAQVRLAELVAALSLGIDLGFGQPMEHVLRQCLIALRLAEGIGLDEEQRAVVYYTALLDQRRLPLRRPRAGQVVRRRHRAEVDQVRPRAEEPADGRDGDAAPRLRAPAASPIPARARVRALRAPRGRRHDRPPRRDRADAWRSSSRCRTRCSRPSARRTSAGTDAAGPASSRARRSRSPRASRRSPSSSRSRTASGASRPRSSSRASGAAGDFDPALADLVEAEADVILSGLDTVGDVGRGHRRRAGARGRARRASASTPRCSRSRTSST